MSVGEFQQAVHKTAVEHGWHEKPMCKIKGNGALAPEGVDLQAVATSLALIHSEVSEALEELRKGEDHIKTYFKNSKPEGMEIELADVIIRILDLAGELGLDIDLALRTKAEFNESRSYRHGGKSI